MEAALPVSEALDKSISYWLENMSEDEDKTFLNYMPQPFSKCSEVPGSEWFPPGTPMNDAWTSAGATTSTSTSVSVESMGIGFLAWGVCCFVAVLISLKQQAPSCHLGLRTVMKAQPVESTLSGSSTTTNIQMQSYAEASTSVELAGPSRAFHVDGHEMLPQLVRQAVNEALPEAVAAALESKYLNPSLSWRRRRRATQAPAGSGPGTSAGSASGWC